MSRRDAALAATLMTALLPALTLPAAAQCRLPPEAGTRLDAGAVRLAWRAEPALKLADYLAELSRFLPPELVSAAAQTSDLTASNVPGLPVPVWLAGARVERMYPLVGTIGAAINVTMLTYTDTASVGMSSDDAGVGDRAELLESLRVGFREVVGESAFIGDPISGQ